MKNRGIARGRLFMGGLLLFAAVIAWATAVLMSPHGQQSADGVDHVKNTVVIFVRNTAIGTLVLTAVAGWLLFPPRRPKWPARDWAIIGIIALLVGTSLWQLYWLYFSVL